MLSNISIDFACYQYENDIDEIIDIVTRSLESCNLDVTGFDLEEVEYDSTDWPEVSDMDVSQINMTFEYDENQGYDEGTILNVLDHHLSEYGYKLLGASFESID